ncbi:MAG TPA: HEAT repeat domain-containing protein [Bryobacteraceae bacterium]|nr:HEAT repeat domain-containing protein [Bryobacteraceae bacterium]
MRKLIPLPPLWHHDANMTRVRLALLVLGAGAAAAIAGSEGLVRTVSEIGTLLQLGGAPLVASSGTLSEHDLEELNAMSPQAQATRLLEKAINHYHGAGEEIAKRASEWTGQIQSTAQLETLTNTAYFSSDLRVRAAALEIWLARDNMRKTTETVEELIRRAAATTEGKWFELSTLGILGNRGVERDTVLNTLLLYVRDPEPAVRSAAINGLGLLGTEGTIAPLLEVLRNDASHDLRERAACNLADSGMLTRELRQKAVPELVRFSQDPNLDETTKKWVFQALREITQQRLGNDAAAWLSWYGTQSGK